MAPQARTVTEYLKALEPERRKALQALRKVIKANLDPKMKEGMQYGSIGYFVPHSVYPDGYHCDPKQPLPFAGLASQKRHMSLHLFCLYTDQAAMKTFVEEWKQSGKKLDMGKSCVRFKSIDDVPLDVVGRAIKRVTARKFIDAYEGSLPASVLRKRAAGGPAR